MTLTLPVALALFVVGFVAGMVVAALVAVRELRAMSRTLGDPATPRPRARSGSRPGGHW